MNSDFIHPTAIIDPNAKIADSVKIGPFCVIGPDVTLDANVELKSHVCIEGHTHIGEGTVVYPFASLGSAPQDLKYKGEPTTLTIGKNNTIREHVTMNTGTKDGGGKTVVGDNGLFMMASHIAHDCHVGNNVIMANNATLGGHVHLGDFVIIGGLAAVHQWTRIGHHAIIGGLSAVVNEVIPYGRAKGERATLDGLNLIGLERRGFDKAQVRGLQKAFKALFAGEGTFDERVQAVESEYADNETVMNIIEFVKAESKIPLCHPAKR